jgi:hypothetical protein
MFILNIIEHKYFATKEELLKEYPNATHVGDTYCLDPVYEIDIYNEKEIEKRSEIIKEENKIERIDNLLLDMSGGLLPENLSGNEVDLLKQQFGDDWFIVLGYSEPEYKKPVCR